jgi:helix-turn-helix protein
VTEIILSAKESNQDGALTIGGFCEKYGQSRSAVYREINAGRLAAKKRGTRVLIDRAEARRWFSNLPKFEARDTP